MSSKKNKFIEKQFLKFSYKDPFNRERSKVVHQRRHGNYFRAGG